MAYRQLPQPGGAPGAQHGIRPFQGEAHFRDQSLMLVTALAPVIGYDMAAKIALHALSEGLSLKQAALALEAIEAEAFGKAVNPGWMAKPHD